MVQSATYNETGFAYNQHCFYYNSGYDNICLLFGYGRKFLLGGSGDGAGGSSAAAGGAAGSAAASSAPSATVSEEVKWINIKVSSRLLSINNEKNQTLDENVQQGKGHLAPGSFIVLGTTIRSLSPAMRYMVKSTTKENLLEKILIKAEHLTGSSGNNPQNKKK